MEGAVALILSMIWTASSIYQVTTAGLSPLQLVLVGTTLEVAVFIFEVPTGVVADVYSRRLSIIVGIILIGLGFLVEGTFPIFWPIIFAQIIWGLGYTFTSGATQAWISDEIGESLAGRAFLRANQVSQVAALLGITAGVLLGAKRINLPIQVGGICLVLVGLLLSLLMPETGFQPAPKKERSSWGQMLETLQAGIKTVRDRPSLRIILGIGFIYGLYSEGLDRLWTKHILDNFAFPFAETVQPVVYIGMVRATSMLLSVGAVEIFKRRVDTDSQSGVGRALLAVTMVLMASLFCFALAPTLLLAIIAFWLTEIAREVINPLYTAWVNQGLESRVRATVLSMSGQVDAIGQIAGGPVVGLIGNLLSVRAALAASGMILSPVLALYRRIVRREADLKHSRLRL